ncbi:hypothetical protein FACS1894205_1390 [Alphaproteobacteria bacterium]|nr:hypothetical protein FACS1894205_1390 [Alphaproteobacteria bacterium]
MEDVLDCDALTLSGRIKRWEISCLEVMAATLSRLFRVNDAVN